MGQHFVVNASVPSTSCVSILQIFPDISHLFSQSQANMKFTAFVTLLIVGSADAFAPGAGNTRNTGESQNSSSLSRRKL